MASRCPEGTPSIRAGVLPATRVSPGNGPSYRWVVALASMVMMTVAMGAPYLVIVALKPIAAEFGWPRAVPSLCYAFALLGAGLGGLLIGRFADRAGMGAPARGRGRAGLERPEPGRRDLAAGPALPHRRLRLAAGVPDLRSRRARDPGA